MPATRTSQSLGLTDPEVAPHPDVALTRLADRQHGVIARRQLASLGMSDTMIRDRIQRGLLARLHRGVYAVGHRQLRPAAHSLAAVLAAGPGAVASHRDAAWLHGLRPGGHRRADVLTSRRLRSTDRIRFHRVAVLPPEDVVTVDHVPTTSLARTLVDLADVVPTDHLERVILEADRRRLLDLRAIDAVLARPTRRHAGRAALLTALDRHRSLALQLDAETLERLLLRIVRSYGLPQPRIRHMLDGREIDACWPAAGVAAELDGWEFHHDRRSFQQDREKSNALTAAGWTVMRFTHRDLAHRPHEVATQLRSVLTRNLRV
ncbi:type IV toxin-antitoxin system AbiEi family antitoxin domain-containing protein [Conexibacter sp. JD483]|uniref:type IV toxin-antitoxin system AbiEi family antitoxin domain-containing protein n=1 Tax=unclassified Conexibacter TaxID=2627773 RepID=UPI0027219BD1|nr:MULTISPECIES: type IV toxin-antitoxin system AbiEi family antitoxin domain-containing protein [unclassified Conexibacter]MDO8186242.1 type IV toxin-antitoxin system AbiEi family antitoxin domain-containing protein [Conexibacter sp. CPCC 205706]MDO8199691.1 type IV toxin-antitoxin system AbiEi family antitoxin domain-containing protein [Conexibacter sp. CPCC 205762]MDR9368217.1 type IV toxin-antitoxin system AbiEi family antitoxin domain-containing protein [Conexibacter sp. JD483]